jgi:hypothetical protein
MKKPRDTQKATQNAKSGDLSPEVSAAKATVKKSNDPHTSIQSAKSGDLSPKALAFKAIEWLETDNGRELSRKAIDDAHVEANEMRNARDVDFATMNTPFSV